MTNTDYEIVSEVFCKKTFTLSRKKSITKRNIFEPDGADDVVLVDAVVELNSACKLTQIHTTAAQYLILVCITYLKCY